MINDIDCKCQENHIEENQNLINFPLHLKQIKPLSLKLFEHIL